MLKSTVIKKLGLMTLLLGMSVVLTSQIPVYEPCPEGMKNGEFMEDSLTCNMYYACYTQMLYKYMCPIGLHFNPATKICDYPFLLDPPCNKG